MLKTDVRSAQEMFEELGYKKDKDYILGTPIYTPTYINEKQRIMFTKKGVVIIGKFKQIVSLSTKEIEAINKQIKELKQC